MALRLTAELEKRIQEQTAAGLYESADELVAEALDLLDAQKLAIQTELERRCDDLASGKVRPIPGSDALTRLRQRIERSRVPS